MNTAVMRRAFRIGAGRSPIRAAGLGHGHPSRKKTGGPRRAQRDRRASAARRAGPMASLRLRTAPGTSPGPNAAFTLIELLVVVAMIALFAGGIGLALRHPGESASLQSAQAAVSILLGAARGRAALSQQPARCAVAADPADSTTFLRFIRVVAQDPGNPAAWLAEDDGFWLPAGVYVVPPSPAGVPGNPLWPASRRSTALPAAAQPMTINGVAGALFYWVQFTPRGTTGGGYLLLTPERLTTGSSGPAPILDDPDNLRGVLLRSSGAVTLIDDAGAFPP